MIHVMSAVNAAYFDYGQAAIKSFAKHNPDCRFVLADIGLTTEQRNALAQFATIVELETFDCARWPHRFARHALMAQCCHDFDGILYQLDVDTLTFGSVMPAVQALQQSDAHVMARRAGPGRKLETVGSRLGAIEHMIPFFKDAGSWYSQPARNCGSMIMQATPELLEAASRTRELLHAESSAFWTDDNTFTAVIYDQRVPILDLPECYNYELPFGAGGDVTLFDPPIDPNHRPIVVAHMIGPKDRLMRLDGPRSALGWWWRKWLEHYREQPWPTE